jgi:putative copper export protein
VLRSVKVPERARRSCTLTVVAIQLELVHLALSAFQVVVSCRSADVASVAAEVVVAGTPFGVAGAVRIAVAAAGAAVGIEEGHRLVVEPVGIASVAASVAGTSADAHSFAAQHQSASGK